MKKTVFSFVVLTVALTFLADGCAARVEQQARSVHLWYQPTVKNAVAIGGTVRVTETQMNSYYCTLGWDCGYCGIQHTPAGRILIFSVWDPVDPMDMTASAEKVREESRARVLFARPDVNVARFGGEGSGARTMTDIGWEVGEPVTVKVVSAPDGTNRTAYTCHWLNPKDGAWEKIATLSTLRHNGRAQGFNDVYSFVEDFWRNGASAQVSRRAEFSDIWTEAAGTGVRTYATSALFSGDQTRSTNVDAGRAENGAFFLQTGGATTNAHVRLWKTVEAVK